jgi:hypothetical protein
MSKTIKIIVGVFLAMVIEGVLALSCDEGDMVFAALFISYAFVACIWVLVRLAGYVRSMPHQQEALRRQPCCCDNETQRCKKTRKPECETMPDNSCFDDINFLDGTDKNIFTDPTYFWLEGNVFHAHYTDDIHY